MQHLPSRRVTVRRLSALLCAASALLLAAFARAGDSAASDVKVWPLFYYASDPVSKESRTEVFWPLYVREKTPAYTANEILSFPHRYAGNYPDQFDLLWPLSGIHTGNGHDIWLFPCIWSGEDYFSLFPAFYYGWGHESRTLNVGLLLHNSWEKDARLCALWPLAWYWHDWSSTGDTLRYGVLPLLWRSTSSSDYSASRSVSNAGGVLLLNWWNRSRYQDSSSQSANSSDGLFPLFYRSDSTQSWKRTNDSGTSADDSLWLALYWQSHERTAHDKPDSGRGFQTRAETRHVLFPVWWDWNVAKDKEVDAGRLFFPFWWASEKSENGERAESATFVVPVGAHFFKKGEYDTQNLLGPVLNRTENVREKYVRYDAFFPFFSLTAGETRSGGRVFPVAGWESRKGLHSNLWYLFPLGWDCESQEAGGYHAEHDARLGALHELETKPFVNNPDCASGPRRTVAFYPFAWSRRQADHQDNGFMPFWWRETWRAGRTVSTETWIPLVLGNFDSSERDGASVYARQDYLLSILAWGRGEEEYRLRRVFPLFSYENGYGRRELWSLLLPFYYEEWRQREHPEVRHSSELSIPFAFLPVYNACERRDGADSASRSSWFFPFYKRSAEKTPERSVEKLSILWPLWNGEWENGETRIRGLGGVTNFYDQDVNGFVEQRFLYRVFSRRSRSWFSEQELMPFYSAQSREDGDGYWKFLGGLVGGETRDDRSYFRVLYLPIPAGKADQPTAEAGAKRQNAHADLALNYLRHSRYDRAAIEFTLAGDARAGDRDFQLAAAEAYLNAPPDAVGDELRSSVPDSLGSLSGKSGGSRMAVRRNLRMLAVKYFENAIALGADKPEMLRKIARAHLDVQETDTALKKLEEAYTLRPSFSTGMERLNILASQVTNTRYETWRDRNPVPPGRAAEYRKQWDAVLAELQTRYPDSPTLVLCENNRPEIRDDDRRPEKEVIFSPTTQAKLAKYERGMAMQSGADEAKWLAEPAAAGRTNHLPGVYEVMQCAGVSPAKECAIQALDIRNRQLSVLLGDKKTADVGALLPAVRNLLPRVCRECGAPPDTSGKAARPEGVYMVGGPLNDAMRNLYRLEVEQRKDPLGYIATAKEWAAELCAHQQKVVERELEVVRFEQQYLKQWRITSQPLVPAGASVSSKIEELQPKIQNFTGPFFERYVNLDAILGAPDRCTAAAECVIVSPDDRQAVLRLGFDHELVAELNGAVVFGPKARKIAVRDEFSVTVALRKGENRLKLTVADDTLAYGFFARLSAPDGRFMEDVAVRLP